MFRLAYIVTHPIQYQAPLLRHLAVGEDIELQVFFLSDFSLHSHYDAAFTKTFQWDVPLTKGYAFEVLPRWFIGPSTPMRSRWPVAGLRSRLRAGRFDAIWVHGWGHVGLRQAVAAGHGLGMPVLLRGESTPNGSDTHGWKRRIRDLLCRRLFARCAAFLCIGSLNRQFYRAFSVAEERMFSMPYAVDNTWFQARCAEVAPQRELLRQELALAPGRPVILFAAKFIPAKAPDDLLTAYQQAFRQDDPERPYLLFVGDGPLRPQLETQARTRANDDVRFLGFRNQTQLPALYDLCDVFVLPSHFEPWGLVVNEVMNAGKPVIVSDRVGAAPDLVRQGENGWIFQTGDVDALGNALRDACANEKRRRTMGQESLDIISQWGFEADRDGLLKALQFVMATPSQLSHA